MASKFYTGIDLCNHELLRARFQNLAAAPTTGVAAGMIYYDNSETSNTKGRAILRSGSSWLALAFAKDFDNYVPLTTFNGLAGSVNSIDARLQSVEKIFETDNDGIINKWNEVVSFLSGVEGSTLEGILATFATKDSVKAMTDWYEAVGKHFKYDSDKVAWYLDGDFYTTGENAAGNAGEAEGGSGDGIVDYDSIVNALGYIPVRPTSLASYLTADAANSTYATISTVNAMASRVDSLEAKSTSVSYEASSASSAVIGTVTIDNTVKEVTLRAVNVTSALGFTPTRKFTGTVAADGATSQTFTHNFNTRDVVVQIFEPTSPYEQVHADIRVNSTNQVTVAFAEAPTMAYKVVIIG